MIFTYMCILSSSILNNVSSCENSGIKNIKDGCLVHTKMSNTTIFIMCIAPMRSVPCSFLFFTHIPKNSVLALPISFLGLNTVLIATWKKCPL